MIAIFSVGLSNDNHVLNQVKVSDSALIAGGSFSAVLISLAPKRRGETRDVVPIGVV